MILDGDGLTHLSYRVERGMSAEGDGNCPELATGNSVLVHIAAGNYSVAGGHAEHTIGGIGVYGHLIDDACGWRCRQRGISKGTEAIVTQPGVHSHGGMLDNGAGTGPMKLLVSAEAEIETSVPGNGVSSDPRVSRARLNDDTVNVLNVEPGISQGVLGSLQVEAHGAAAGNPPLGSVAQPHNGTPVFQAHSAIPFQARIHSRLVWHFLLPKSRTWQWRAFCQFIEL